MSRIDISYFTDFRNIANLNDEDIRDILGEKIDRLEPEFFTKIFGYEFQSIMLADDNNPIYEPILNGVEFRNADDKLVKWEGINESIANYVYFYFYKERTPLTGGVAFANGKVENMSVANNQTRPIYSFNKIYDSLCILEQYLEVNIDEYPTLEFNNLEKLNDFGL